MCGSVMMTNEPDILMLTTKSLNSLSISDEQDFSKKLQDHLQSDDVRKELSELTNFYAFAKRREKYFDRHIQTASSQYLDTQQIKPGI